MPAYKVRIKRYGSGTDLIGELVVVGNSKEEALSLCIEDLNSIGRHVLANDFDEPVELKRGDVVRHTRSAWEGYR